MLGKLYSATCWTALRLHERQGIERFHRLHAVLQHGRRIAQTELDIQGSHKHHSAHDHHALEPRMEKYMKKLYRTIM